MSVRLAAALAAAGALALPAAAGRDVAGSVTLVAAHLDNPRQVTATATGALYVAEAGKAGPACGARNTCVGFSGGITRVKDGKATRIAGNLVSAGGKDGTFAVGADGVAVAPDGTLFVVVTALPDCASAKGLPALAARQLGAVLRFGRDGPRPYGNVGAAECAHNYDHADRNSNPYAGLALSSSRVLVVDAGANALFDVSGGRVSLVTVFPKTATGAQSVPTSLAVGPDGAWYVGELVGASRHARRHAARVFRVDPQTHARSVFAQGFDAITGLAFDRVGTMYVTEASLDPLNGRELRGDVVRVPQHGARTRLGIGKLFFPSGAAVGADGDLYVANYSVLPGSTPRTGPFHGAGGQLVRIALS